MGGARITGLAGLSRARNRRGYLPSRVELEGNAMTVNERRVYWLALGLLLGFALGVLAGVVA